MEVDLDESYTEALVTIPNNGWIKSEQFDWMTKARNACQDQTCLRQAYGNRIDELFWIKKHSAE